MLHPKILCALDDKLARPLPIFNNTVETVIIPEDWKDPLLLFIYINDLDTNILIKMSKFADDTKLCNRAGNPDDITELQEDINEFVEWANTWRMSFNVHVDKCSVMHIEHNMQGDYYMSNQQLSKTDQQCYLGIIITKDLKLQKQTAKSCKTTNRALGFIARNNYRCKKEEKCPVIITVFSVIRYNDNQLASNKICNEN